MPDAQNKAIYRGFCDDVPQDIPKIVNPDGTYDDFPADDRDWGKHIEACNALLKDENPDPDLYYYAGRLELKELNFSRAGQRFRQGAEAGSVKAMTAYGLYLAPKDPEGMLKWFHKAADQGDPMAQTALGLTYSGIRHWSQAVELDHDRAHEFLEAAAAQGDPLAHYMLGVMAWPEKEEANEEALKKALNHVRTAARTGLIEAQQLLREEEYELPVVERNPRWPPISAPLLRIMRRP